MPIARVERFSLELCRSLPDALFVFGDNDRRVGSGPRAGQAVIRHEPNAHGIRTKRAPSMEGWAFYSDRNLATLKAQLMVDIKPVMAALTRGATVVLPSDGLGTGRAELPQRAPRFFSLLCRTLEALERRYGTCDLPAGQAPHASAEPPTRSEPSPRLELPAGAGPEPGKAEVEPSWMPPYVGGLAWRG